MKKALLISVLCAPISLAPQVLVAADADTAQLKREAVAIVKQFGGRLKPELQRAIKAGGPVNAISVCAEKAPSIAQNLSLETGWKVKRVSLKPRNPRSAVPDGWEREVLERFDQRQADGEPAAEMAYAEIVDGKYRFMKAQGVESVCLNCHAAEIRPEVEAAIERYYPQDLARGYTLGQVRGAFSLTRDLR